jgi:hypothetical protein
MVRRAHGVDAAVSAGARPRLPVVTACLAMAICPLGAGAGGGENETGPEDRAPQKSEEELSQTELVKILDIDPEILRALPFSGALTPLRKRRLDAWMTVGGGLTSGNTSNVSLQAQATLSWRWAPDWALTARALEFLQRAEGRTVGSNTNGLLRLDHVLGERLSLHVAGEIERRPFNATGLLYGGFLGAGYTNVRTLTPRGGTDPLRLELGAFVDREQATIPPASPPGTMVPDDRFTRAGLRALVGYAHLFTSKTALAAIAELREDFVQAHHLVARLGVGLYVPLVDPIQLKLGAAYRFDSKPILDSLQKGDLLLIWGLACHFSLPES